MRAGWLLASGLVLAACGHSDDTGIEIDVHVPAGMGSASELVLYLGQDPPTAPVSTAIQTQHSGAKVPAVVYRRDPNNGTDRIALTPGKSDYVFYFRADAADPSPAIAVVAAVAVTADNAPVGLAVLDELAIVDAGHVYRYPLTLVPATDLARAPTLATDTTGVELWPDEPAGQFGEACARVARAGVTTDLLFVDDTDDPDCDSFTATTECDADAFDATKVAEVPPTQFSCTGERTVSVMSMGHVSDQTICEIGGVACVDGQGSSRCGGSAYCMQAAVCDACPDPQDSACAIQVTGAISVHCTLGAEPNEDPGMAGTATLCADSADLPAIVAETFDDLAVLTPSGHLGSKLPFGATSGQGELDVGGSVITATGTVSVINAPPSLTGLLFATLEQGGGRRGVAVPFRADVQLVAACADEQVAKCVVEGPTEDDVFLDCLQSDPPPGDAL